MLTNLTHLTCRYRQCLLLADSNRDIVSTATCAVETGIHSKKISSITSLLNPIVTHFGGHSASQGALAALPPSYNSRTYVRKFEAHSRSIRITNMAEQAYDKTKVNSVNRYRARGVYNMPSQVPLRAPL